MIVLKRLRIHAFKHTRDVEIWFPRRGSLLIEGQNEAGKSTLFEAVYFGLYGSPLVGEDTRATLEDLIPHGGTSASIELTVVAGQSELDIRRTVDFGRAGRHAAQQARVIVRRPGAPREEIHGPRPVNARILRELRDLDADTLRNSCFMEQKALDRLESLSRGQREVAIARLLGLDHLQQVGRALESESAELRRELETRRGELEVAIWQERAREAAERAGEWETVAAVADIRALIEQRDTVAGAAAGKAERIAALHEQMQATERRIRDAERVKELLEQVQSLRDPLQAALAERQNCQRLVEERASLDRADQETAQPLAQRFARLNEIDATLAWLREADAERAELQELNAVAIRREEAHVACEAARQQFESVEAHCAQLELRDRLREWIHMTERSALREMDAAGRERLIQARDKADCVERRAERRSRALLATACGFLLVAVAGAAGGVNWTPLWGVAALALVISAALTIQWSGMRRGGAQRREAIQQARDALTRFDARAEVSRDLPSTTGDLANFESALQRAGIVLPLSLAEGRRRLDQLSPADEMSLAAARDERERARTVLTQRETHASTMDAQLAELRGRLGSRYDHLQTPDQLASALDGVRTRRNELATASAALVASLEVALDEGAVAHERGATLARLRLLEEQLTRRTSLAEEMELAQAALEERARDLSTRLSSVAGEARALGVQASSMDLEVLDLDRLDLVWKTLHATLANAYMRLEEGSERERLAALASRVEMLEQSAGESGMGRAAAIRALQEALAARGVTCVGDEPTSALCALWPPLAQLPPSDDHAIESALLDARNEAFHARETAARSAKARGLEDVALDVAESRERVARCEMDLRRRETAAQMAAETQARIFRRVLPETALHMRTLLPDLTEGRYRDVELMADEGSGAADLKIRVWDQIAGRYVAKNLFSGGARDQFSLALRLAFALATLPKEVGATPGFVFLDEPLSSFDGERSRALVEILTTGAIARQFAQVMLVAHSRSFDNSRFTYRLRMAGGRIVESNLPDAREAERLWAAETAIVEQAGR